VSTFAKLKSGEDVGNGWRGNKDVYEGCPHFHQAESDARTPSMSFLFFSRSHQKGRKKAILTSPGNDLSHLFTSYCEREDSNLHGFCPPGPKPTHYSQYCLFVPVRGVECPRNHRISPYLGDHFHQIFTRHSETKDTAIGQVNQIRSCMSKHFKFPA